MMEEAGRPSEMAMHHLYDDRQSRELTASTHNPMNTAEVRASLKLHGVQSKRMSSVSALAAGSAAGAEAAEVDFDLYNEYEEDDAGLELDENGYDEFGGYYDEQGRYVSPFREGADNEQAKAEAEAAAARFRERESEAAEAAQAGTVTGYDSTLYSQENVRRGSEASILSGGSRNSSRSKKSKKKAKKDKELLGAPNEMSL